MPKVGGIIVTILLLAVICLQILAALNIFPRTTLVKVCPVNAISLRDSKAVVDANKCIGCKRCVLGVATPLAASSAKLNPAAGAQTITESEQESGPKTPLAPDKTEPSQAANTPAAKAKAAPVAEPAVQVAYKVDPGTCIGCGLCVMNCPVQAITLVNGKAVIDPKKCIQCGICKNGNGDDFAGCPVSAISAP